MATLAAVKPLLTGTTYLPVAVTAGGDQFTNTGNQQVMVTNAHATLARTVTFASPNADNFGVINAAHNAAIVVAALTTKAIGPFATGRFNDANGMVQVTYSDSGADLTIAVLDPVRGA